MSDIYKNHGGLPGFYQGVGPTVVRASVLNASWMGSYDSIKHKILDTGHVKEGLPVHFFSSLFSGFVVVGTSCPLDNIKTRIMD